MNGCAQRRLAEPHQDASAATQPKDVLVVDDDAEIRELVAEALEADGYSVRLAQSGADALDAIRHRKPDVAIIDLYMPGMPGDEVCALIRRDAGLSGIRILVLSAADDARIVAANCDADSAVTKPFTIGLLKHEVRRLVGP